MADEQPIQETAPAVVAITPHEVRDRLESALFEIKRVIAGQDEMLERVLVAPARRRPPADRGRARAREDADRSRRSPTSLGGTFSRIQFTPDLVPADLVGTRDLPARRPATFDVELGPVFCNFLLADEINRAPAKVQSALLEVMQERQVTIGGDDASRARRRSSCSRRRTRSSPRAPTRCPRRRSTASCSRCVVDYPAPSDELTVVRALARAPRRGRSSRARARRARRAPGATARRSTSTRRRQRYAVALATATREPERVRARASSSRYIAFGASPRGSINLVHAARALALAARPALRAAAGRRASSRRTCCATGSCSPTRRSPRSVTADPILDARARASCPMPQIELARAASRDAPTP